MKEYEIHVFAGYITDGGSKHYNCFKEYVTADNETKAMETLKEELESEGYIEIKMEAIPV